MPLRADDNSARGSTASPVFRARALGAVIFFLNEKKWRPEIRAAGRRK